MYGKFKKSIEVEATGDFVMSRLTIDTMRSIDKDYEIISDRVPDAVLLDAITYTFALVNFYGPKIDRLSVDHVDLVQKAMDSLPLVLLENKTSLMKEVLEKEGKRLVEKQGGEISGKGLINLANLL